MPELPRAEHYDASVEHRGEEYTLKSSLSNGRTKIMADIRDILTPFLEGTSPILPLGFMFNCTNACEGTQWKVNRTYDEPS